MRLKQIISVVLLFVMAAASVNAVPAEEKEAEKILQEAAADEVVSSAAADTEEDVEISLCSTASYAVTGGNIYFNTSTGTVISADMTVTEAVIPSEIEGVSVAAIGEYAFISCSNLKSVTIPDTVTEIEDWAFYMSGLETVNIPSAVKNVGSYAFFYCSSLTSVSCGAQNIGESAFRLCTELKTLILEEGVESIGGEVFKSCTSLESITFPSTISTIDTSAFENLKNIQYVYCYKDTCADNEELYAFSSECTIVYLDGEDNDDDDNTAYNYDLGTQQIVSSNVISMCVGDKITLYPAYAESSVSVASFTEWTSESSSGGSVYLNPYDNPYYCDVIAHTPGTVTVTFTFKIKAAYINYYNTYTSTATINICGYRTADMVNKYDINGDEAVTVDDAQAIADHITGSSILTASDKISMADVNGDGEITGADAVNLMRIIYEPSDTDGVTSTNNSASLYMTSNNKIVEDTGDPVIIYLYSTGKSLASIEGKITYDTSAFEIAESTVENPSNGVKSSGDSFNFVYSNSEGFDTDDTQIAKLQLTATSGLTGTETISLSDVEVTDIYGNKFNVGTNSLTVAKYTPNEYSSYPVYVKTENYLEYTLNVGDAINFVNSVTADEDLTYVNGKYYQWNIDSGGDLISFTGDLGTSGRECRVVAIAPGEVNITARMMYRYTQNQNQYDENYGYIKLTIVGDALDFYSDSAITTTEAATEATTSDSQDSSSDDTQDSIKGDLNGDGKVSTKDAVLALQMSVGQISTDTAADVNGDGKVSTKDAVLILQYAVGQIDSF